MIYVDFTKMTPSQQSIRARHFIILEQMKYNPLLSSFHKISLYFYSIKRNYENFLPHNICMSSKLNCIIGIFCYIYIFSLHDHASYHLLRNDYTNNNLNTLVVFQYLNSCIFGLNSEHSIGSIEEVSLKKKFECLNFMICFQYMIDQFDVVFFTLHTMCTENKNTSTRFSDVFKCFSQFLIKNCESFGLNTFQYN